MPQWGLCKYVIVHTILGGSPVILWISLGGKPKWLPLKFGYHDVMHTSPIAELKCAVVFRFNRHGFATQINKRSNKINGSNLVVVVGKIFSGAGIWFLDQLDALVLKGEVRTINVRNICERKCCMFFIYVKENAV